MPFGFDTKQQIANYIAQECHWQSRYVIDSYLLQAGCNPALVDQVWRELARPKRYSRLVAAWSFLNFKIAFWILWTGIGLGFILGWNSMELGLTDKSFLIPLIIWIIVFLWRGVSLKLKGKPLLPGWTRWLIRIGIIFSFLFYISSPIYTYSYTLCAAPHPYALDRLVTSESHFVLMDASVPGPPNFEGWQPQVYEVNLYQCNTSGLGCRLIVQEDFPQVHLYYCVLPKLHLQLGPDGQAMIVQE